VAGFLVVGLIEDHRIRREIDLASAIQEVVSAALLEGSQVLVEAANVVDEVIGSDVVVDDELRGIVERELHHFEELGHRRLPERPGVRALVGVPSLGSDLFAIVGNGSLVDREVSGIRFDTEPVEGLVQ
jgi:SpoVK/Ycf46/Vps4 family AAA+-type ATPase